MEDPNQPEQNYHPGHGYGQSHEQHNSGDAGHHQPHHQMHNPLYPDPNAHAAPQYAAPQPQYNAPQYNDSYGNYNQPAAWSPAPMRGRGLLKSTAYLPEYVVMLILLLTMVSSLVTLLGLGIDSLIKAEEASSSSLAELYGGSGLNSFQLIWSLTTLIASFPFFAWLFVRTRSAEAETPAIRQHRWRKAFLGIFLVLEGLTAIWFFGSFVFDTLSRMIGDTSGLFSYLSADGGPDPWWQGLLTTILSLALLGLVVFVMSRDYKSKKDES